MINLLLQDKTYLKYLLSKLRRMKWRCHHHYILSILIFIFCTIPPSFAKSLVVQKKATAVSRKIVQSHVHHQENYQEEMKQKAEAYKKKLEVDIALSIQDQAWADLLNQVAAYEKIEDKDDAILHYTKGKIHFAHQQYKEAIADFRASLSQNPTNVEVRLSLAISLYKNKEYITAQDQFYKINAADISAETRRIIERYQILIMKENSWDYSVNVDFLKANNDDSYERILQIQEKEDTHKTAHTMSHNALGFGYKLGINKNIAVTGNHYLVPSVELRGWRYSESSILYDEFSSNIGLGYLYMTPKAVLEITPLYQEIMVNHQFFEKNTGFNVRLKQPVNRHWQWITEYTWMDKHYYNHLYQDYNGQLQEIHVAFVYLSSPTLKTWWGAHIAMDHLQSVSESSHRKGIELGIEKEWFWGVSTQFNVKWTHRNYLGHHTEWVTQQRNDNDMTVMISLWHRNTYLWGITPRVNYMYRHINSSIPALYNRKFHQLFMTLEKVF